MPGRHGLKRLANLHAFERQPEPLRPAAAATIEALRAARAYVAKGWSPTSWALNAAGEWSSPDGPGAVRWNPGGAFIAAAANRKAGADACLDASSALQRLVPDGYVDLWNRAPGRTQAEVLALFDRAIAQLGDDPEVATLGGGARKALPPQTKFGSREEWLAWCERDRRDELMEQLLDTIQ